jgi:hypothetical protein
MIEHRSTNIRELAKTETLIESLDTYHARGGSPNATELLYEVARAAA